LLCDGESIRRGYKGLSAPAFYNTRSDNPGEMPKGKDLKRNSIRAGSWESYLIQLEVLILRRGIKQMI